MRFYHFFFLLLLSSLSFAQTGPGIAIYPTGTETGLGFRSARDTRWALDVRATRANFYSEKNKTSSFVTEVSAICRVIRLEKVRFHIGIGYRGDWNFTETNRHGIVVPVGVEAFPFPFQNAGLFFEAAPFVVSDFGKSTQGGIRTVAGFVFYLPVKQATAVAK
ncbi:MAG: hypothetical protein JWO58_2198 [Chitinophagaceae bacterium]|nr:hypothetical protein [Chitinophagaceae bacterium]